MSKDGCYGGKGQIYRQLINEMPPHEVYVAVFCGHDSVMRNKRPAGLNIGIDLDSVALQWMANEVCPHPASTLGELRGDGVLAMPDELEEMGIGRYMEVSALFEWGQSRWEFVRACGMRWLENREWVGNEFVYCDPPYLWETRSSLTSGYEYEMSKGDHERLLDVLLDLSCNVMVSGYWSELYGEMLAGWRVKTMRAMTRGGVVRKEYIWMNYDAPVKLHDYSWLGDDYRERERIKRKIGRWKRKLGEMDLLERRALMSALEGMG